MGPLLSRPATQPPSGRAVGEVMRPAVTTVETGGHLAAAAYLMNHAGQSALVVVDLAGRPVAIITEADLLRAVAHGEDTGQAVIQEWMNRDPQTVRPDTTLTEAAQLMLDTATRHLPVVSDGQVVGIVAITDIVQALTRSVRLASVVVFVSDLIRSLGFYQPLLRYAVTVTDVGAALLAGPDGSQLCLYQTGNIRRGAGADGVGVQWVAWTAGSPEDLDRCTELLKERGAFQRRDTSEGIAVLEGRDPDGLPVLISHPGPDQVPRRMLDPSLPSRVIAERIGQRRYR
jgi:CBS domain-containing protein